MERERETSDTAQAGVPCRAFDVRADGAAWRSALQGTPLRPEPERRSKVVVLDSFDRRLQEAGVELEIVPGDRVPVFVWDLEPALAQKLAGVLEARALRPLGEHALIATCWAVLDDQRKVVARIEEQVHDLRPSARLEPIRIRRLVLQGVRGYDAEFTRLAALLQLVPGLVPVAEAGFDPRVQLSPPARSVGRWPRLSPDVTAIEALARIARAQLAILRSNGAGLLANEDAEFLHDARVAMRRLRSLLSQLKGVLEAHEQQALVDELRWLASCTGPARDLDTLLFELRMSEPELRAELEPVVAAFAFERERLQAALREEYGSKRAQALRARLRSVFSGKPDPRFSGPNAGEPFQVLLAKRLRRRFRQVVELVGRLSAHSPAPELHELRISCKKLRYPLECCRGLVPKNELAGAFAHLKGLQSDLGTLQDSVVHIQLARSLALEHAGGAGARAHLALGRFLERLTQNGAAARARATELTTRFLAPDSRAGFKSILRALEPREGEAP